MKQKPKLKKVLDLMQRLETDEDCCNNPIGFQYVTSMKYKSGKIEVYRCDSCGKLMGVRK